MDQVPQTKLNKQWSIQQTPQQTPIPVSTDMPSMNTPVLGLMPSTDFLDLNAGLGCSVVDAPNHHYQSSVSDDNDNDDMKRMGLNAYLGFANDEDNNDDVECASEKSFKTISSSSSSSSAATSSMSESENSNHTQNLN